LETAAFIREILLGEVRLMRNSGAEMQLLAAMAHGIEVCGALLDDRPFKAKGLGRSRFTLAIRSLFPKPYSDAGKHVDLYGQLRSHMSHAMLPGQLVRVGEGRHLMQEGKAIHISLRDLFHDYEAALERLLAMVERGELPPKRIAG
jgi:hypothetical protein